ncbi:M56 family metallopeptidase [Gillisia sp. Hel_I_29]|uniref:M56 family metallopeptidase n=1 Tax=Gillisia sp. Hel_I_29 TaxID=1249975 RepID=UPI0005595A42|nr:M56 family metallopeptidase [Gillisia sp. Hel_I_29]
MHIILIYLLKSAVLISVFYILYILLLQKDTNFQINRKYLLGGILTSFVLPGIYLTRKILVAPVDYSQFENVGSISTPIIREETIDWWQIVGVIYLLITAALLIRFIFQLLKLLHFINTSKIIRDGNFKFIESTKLVGPFSFFNFIVFNPTLHSKDDIDLILIHEKVHASQLHSIDIIIGNVASLLLWFHPLMPFYKKKIVQNLEYIADLETVKRCSSKKEYLQALVKVSTNEYHPSFTNSFYQSFIKKRILMLHTKNKSHSSWKIALIFPLLLSFMLIFNVNTEAQTKKVTSVKLESIEWFPDTLASAIITSTHTTEMLKTISENFKKYGIELHFQDLKYSEEGYLTEIQIIYLNLNNNESGKFERSGNTPIKPIEIIFDEDQKVEFKSTASPIRISLPNDTTGTISKLNKEEVVEPIIERSSTNKPTYLFSSGSEKVYYPTGNSGSSGMIGQNYSINTSNPVTNFERDTTKSKNRIQIVDTVEVYQSKSSKEKSITVTAPQDKKILTILNGKKLPLGFDINTISPETIEYVNVLKGDNATHKYGNEGKYGVIEISTKSRTDQSELDDTIKIVKTASGDKKLNITPKYKDILVVVNGEIKSKDFSTDAIDPENIKSVYILKDRTAIKKYGERGKNGVIVITLKEK